MEKFIFTTYLMERLKMLSEGMVLAKNLRN
jgi:hypothetical protein